jgi:hypothetical protein
MSCRPITLVNIERTEKVSEIICVSVIKNNIQVIVFGKTNTYFLLIRLAAQEDLRKTFSP